jgi:Acetyltransferase (GNAT) domain
MANRDTTSALDWEVRPLEEKDRNQLVPLLCDKDFMVGLSRPLDNTEAHHRFTGMLNLANLLPHAEQPILNREADGLIGYSGISLLRLTATELASFDASERANLAGTQLELNCRLVDDARGIGIGPCASWEILKIWKATSGREVFAKPNLRSKKMVKRLGFENIKRVGSWELWKLEPHRLQKPGTSAD